MGCQAAQVLSGYNELDLKTGDFVNSGRYLDISLTSSNCLLVTCDQGTANRAQELALTELVNTFTVQARSVIRAAAMFYSHEILTSRQYGVATIWWVATIGRRGATKVISRKAIRNVQIKKACEKIIDPGAPLALRLQSNLLYGVSRVYSEQCRYVLDDAEKVRSAMVTLYNQFGKMNATDPKAGKATPGQNIIPDDPYFNIDNITFPELNLDIDNVEGFFQRNGMGSQSPSMMFSQPSPLDQSLCSLSSSRNSLAFDFLEAGQNSPQLPTRLVVRAGSLPKSTTASGLILGDDDALVLPEGGFNFEVDADGNLIDLGDPELSTLPGLDLDVPNLAQQEEMQIHFDGPVAPSQTSLPAQPEAIMFEEPLPDAEAFQPLQHYQQPQMGGQDTQAPSTREVPAQRRRRRGPNVGAFLDKMPPQIDDAEYKSTGERYIERSEAETFRRQDTSVAKARKNAFNVMFGAGIAGVGRDLGVAGVQHPLAGSFAGHALRNSIFGVSEIDSSMSPPSERARGSRRTASQAFPEETEEQDHRMKKRTESQEQALNDEMVIPEGDEILPEVGRRGQSIAEPRSSSGAPWSRQGSIIPGSSVKSVGGCRSRQVTASPMVKQNSHLPDIERFSDPHLPSDDNPGHGATGVLESSSFGDYASLNESQMRKAVDQAGADFLTYATEKAKEIGAPDIDKKERKWVYFDELVNPAMHGREVAAQAFYHTLALATRNEIIVEQEGGAFESFGRIEIGVVVGEDEGDKTKDMEEDGSVI
ncbi:hypothetical protein jhhlp_004165 [Lomentospora prolificans]|uniref:Rad21/Rec8-like protein N-terminal domain-containing protein n=1 Tax=Lomentospora prolificans TaxID=41688 RepID=A0A2N3NAT7_9PEZI|nr:hypothetical protein jhhlp_004165 [Lomentospora prolificans]